MPFLQAFISLQPPSLLSKRGNVKEARVTGVSPNCRGPGIGAHDRGEWVMARLKSLRSQLYRAARDLGNVQAAHGGPTSYGKRVVRRKVYRTTNGINRRVPKDLGL
jgi:hypothetical protein